MKKKAGLFFSGICIVLAMLLLADLINPIFGGILVALALVTLGILSKRF